MARPGQRPRPLKVSESVARDIVAEVANGRVHPGMRLPTEATMLEQYGIARASLREALRLLETQGLIGIRTGPNGGPVVLDGSEHPGFEETMLLHLRWRCATYGELVEARSVIEPLMARRAALLARDEDRKQLRRLLDDVAALDVADAEAFVEQSNGFHQFLLRMSDNRVLDLLGRAVQQLHTSRFDESPVSEDDRRSAVKVHLKIGEAVLAKDAAKAENLMRKHIDGIVESTRARYPGLLNEIVDWT